MAVEAGGWRSGLVPSDPHVRCVCSTPLPSAPDELLTTFSISSVLKGVSAFMYIEYPSRLQACAQTSPIP